MDIVLSFYNIVAAVCFDIYVSYLYVLKIAYYIMICLYFQIKLKIIYVMTDKY